MYTHYFCMYLMLFNGIFGIFLYDFKPMKQKKIPENIHTQYLPPTSKCVTYCFKLNKYLQNVLGILNKMCVDDNMAATKKDTQGTYLSLPTYP